MNGMTNEADEKDSAVDQYRADDVVSNAPGRMCEVVRHFSHRFVVYDDGRSIRVWNQGSAPGLSHYSNFEQLDTAGAECSPEGAGGEASEWDDSPPDVCEKIREAVKVGEKELKEVGQVFVEIFLSRLSDLEIPKTRLDKFFDGASLYLSPGTRSNRRLTWLAANRLLDALSCLVTAEIMLEVREALPTELLYQAEKRPQIDADLAAVRKHRKAGFNYQERAELQSRLPMVPVLIPEANIDFFADVLAEELCLEKGVVKDQEKNLKDTLVRILTRRNFYDALAFGVLQVGPMDKVEHLIFLNSPSGVLENLEETNRDRPTSKLASWIESLRILEAMNKEDREALLSENI